jgi:soluble lytic murein transglycosylase-like protein
MTIRKLIVAAACVCGLYAADAVAERRFTAADLPAAGIGKTGRIVISNDDTSITAARLDGNLRETLVSLRSQRVRSAGSFGTVVFDGNATPGPRVPAALASTIQEAGRTHGVDPRLIAAVAARESSWRANAESPKGAQGVMQLMPQTAAFLGVTNAFDVRQNIFGGTRYLRMLLETFEGDLDLTLAAYNAGPGAVRRHRGIPPYSETRAYVAAVRTAYVSSLAAR